jgi:hypothetical protein
MKLPLNIVKLSKKYKINPKVALQNYKQAELESNALGKGNDPKYIERMFKIISNLEESIKVKYDKRYKSFTETMISQDFNANVRPSDPPAYWEEDDELPPEYNDYMAMAYRVQNMPELGYDKGGINPIDLVYNPLPDMKLKKPEPFDPTMDNGFWDEDEEYYDTYDLPNYQNIKGLKSTKELEAEIEEISYYESDGQPQTSQSIGDTPEHAMTISQTDKKKKRKKRYVTQSEEESKVEEKNTNRDYKKEYDNYHSKPEQKKNRAKRNKARRDCKCEKGDGMEVDHIVPLSKGGSNEKSNVRVVTQKTNRKKKDK